MACLYLKHIRPPSNDTTHHPTSLHPSFATHVHRRKCPFRRIAALDRKPIRAAFHACRHEFEGERLVVKVDLCNVAPSIVPEVERRETWTWTLY